LAASDRQKLVDEDREMKRDADDAVVRFITTARRLTSSAESIDERGAFINVQHDVRVDVNNIKRSATWSAVQLLKRAGRRLVVRDVGEALDDCARWAMVGNAVGGPVC